MATSIPFRYSAPVRWIHWLTVLLVATAYLTSESAEELGDGGGGQWHVFAGLALLLVFVPRLIARLASTHYSVMTRDSAMFVAGPPLVARLGKSMSKQELGGADKLRDADIAVHALMSFDGE